MAKERLRKLPSGNDGKAYSLINGEMLNTFIILKISPRLENTVEEGNFLGERMMQHALRKTNGTGSLTYVPTTYFPKLMKAWKETGVFPETTIQYYNEINNVHGRGEYQLRDVILNNIAMGMLDNTSTEMIQADTDFTFDDYDVLSEMV